MLRGKYSNVVFSLRLGEAAIRKCIQEQVAVLRQDTFESMGDYPTMMGEIGIPFDLDQKKAYKTGDYTSQTRALDASLNACDGPNVLNYTIWSYGPENSHQWGDGWNGEDLSIWSPDDMGRRTKQEEYPIHPPASIIPRGLTPESTTSLLASLKLTNGSMADVHKAISFLDLNDGARSLPAFCRPFPMSVVGRPVQVDFDIKSSLFKLTISVRSEDVKDPDIPTEIFVPLVHYATHPKSVAQAVRDDEVTVESKENGVGGEQNGNGGSSMPPSNSESSSTSISLSTLADTSSSSNATAVVDPGEYQLEQLRTETAPHQGGLHVDVDSQSIRASHVLDVEVEISAGSWEVDGQTLKWWYPRPENPGMGSWQETIVIKRASGPIATWTKLYGESTSAVNAVNDRSVVVIQDK